MNDNNAAQDELQQAINSITNASNASASDSADAVAQIENRLNGGKDKKESEVKKPEEKKEDKAEIGKFGSAPEPKPVELGPIPAPKAPEPPAMPDFMKNATQPIGTGPLQASYGDPDLNRVKTNALSDLRPIIEKIDLPAGKKFLVYKEIIETTSDKACIEPAYNAAKTIEDEKERAEALLFIVESINKLGVQMPKE